MSRQLRYEMLDRYLLQRYENLGLVLKDMLCRPFSREPAVPELVLAVDWSEIHAYIFVGPPQVEEPIGRLVGPDTAAAAHQVALTVLFDRLTMLPLIVLPPYFAEMSHLVSLVRAHLITLDTDLDQKSALLTQLQKSGSLSYLAEMATRFEDRNEKLEATDFEAEFSKLKRRDAKKIVEWISSEYSEIFLLARISTVKALHALRFLLGADSAATRRLVTLRDCSSPSAEALQSMRPGHQTWRDRLYEKHPTKDKGALDRDGQALDQLDYLNGVLHNEGRQLLFATRGYDIGEVMKDHAGRFACLSDHYYDGTLHSSVPVIARSWHYFLELGLAWASRPDTRLPDVEKIVSRVMNMRRDVAGKREWLHARRKDIDTIMATAGRELNLAIQNQCHLLGTERPYLPADQSEENWERALGWYVQHITDPEKFSSERAAIRRDIETVLDNIQLTLDLSYRHSFTDEAFSPSFKPLTVSFIEKYDNRHLTVDVETRGIRKTLGDLYDALRSPQDRGGARSGDLANVLRHSSINPHARDATNIDLARLATTSVYVCGAFRRVEYLLNRFPILRMDDRVLTPGWILAVLMNADVRIARGAPLHANVALRRAWREAKPRLDGSEATHKSALGLLCCWLLVHLDMVEDYGENIAAFPPDPDDSGLLELEYIMEESRACLEAIHSWKSEHRLRRALYNNMVYAASRLVPIREEAGELFAQQAEASPRTSTVYLDDKTTVLFVRYLRRNRDLSPDECDTLAYFYIKRAAQRHFAGATARNAIESARVFLSRGLDGVGVNHRVRSFLERHKRLLDSLLQMANPGMLEGVHK